MQANELLVGLLITFLILMATARRLRVAPPIALVLGGIVLGFVPGLPDVELDPELVLLAFLPPLLFWEASSASWREIKRNLRSITLLAVGLVLATMAAVAVVAHALLPGLPWFAAFVLGAVLSPTDPVAILAITRRLPIPKRILDVLVGESLVNDATALVAFRFALAATAAGGFALGEAAAWFAYGVAAGATVGLASGWIVLRLRHVLAWDSLHDNLLILLAPFVAYLAAEVFEASGVLAVVASGLYIGRRLPDVMPARTRLEGSAVWEMIVFVLNGMIFVLVGLQLRIIVQQPLFPSIGAVVAAGVAIAVAVMAARIAFVLPAAFVPGALDRVFASGAPGEPVPPRQPIWVLGWSGMRGGVSLAAALAIPATAGARGPFPWRDEIVLITYVVVVVILVLQGLTLPRLIRALAIAPDETAPREEALARLKMAEAAVSRLDELAKAGAAPSGPHEKLRGQYAERVQRLMARRDLRPDAGLEARVGDLAFLRWEALEAERMALILLRDRGTIGDEILHRLQAELDVEVLQAHASGAAGRG